MSNNKKSKFNNAPSVSHSNNYFSPLQTIEDEEGIDEIIIEKNVKVNIPPITILKCKIEEVHELCKISKITDYSIRKISIGLKLFVKSKSDFDTVCNLLANQYEFFTYATKHEKPYKALIFGLDKQDPMIVKKKLTDMGLKCLEVKIVVKKNNLYNSEYVIYVVYFERQTITIKELRQSYSVIDYIKVKWEFQKPNKSKITQCYNCQMFGHGSSRCKVKTFCANCAGNHKTSECKETTVKCANCSGTHKSTYDKCPNKENYISIRQRTQPASIRHTRDSPTRTTTRNYNSSFPDTLRQNVPAGTGTWQTRGNIASNSGNNSGITSDTNELFSIQEIKALTLELISNLKNCKNKADQFEVITNLAVKFLS